MILIGEKDDWTPASRCVDNMPSGETSHKVILKVYPGAFHDFDWEGLDTYAASHRVKFNPAAAADAVAWTRAFPARHLAPPPVGSP